MESETTQTEETLNLEQRGSVLTNVEKELGIFLKPILEQLKPYVDGDIYGVIVADDRGGRVPAKVISAVINRYYREVGKEEIPLVFVQGLRREEKKNEDEGLLMPDFAVGLDKLTDVMKMPDVTKRVLLVTDRINTGGTIKAFEGMFRKARIGFDIVSLAAEPLEYFPEGSRLFLGTREIDCVPLIDKHSYLSGLDSNKAGLHRVIKDREIRGLTLKIRKDCEEMGNSLYQEFLAFPKGKIEEVPLLVNDKSRVDGRINLLNFFRRLIPIRTPHS